MFRKIEILAEEVEDEISVDFVLVGLLLTNGEDETSSLLITGILPFGFDALLKVLDGVDPAPLFLDEVAACGGEYVFCLLLLCSKK